MFNKLIRHMKQILFSLDVYRLAFSSIRWSFVDTTNFGISHRFSPTFCFHFGSENTFDSHNWQIYIFLFFDSLLEMENSQFRSGCKKIIPSSVMRYTVRTKRIFDRISEHCSEILSIDSTYGPGHQIIKSQQMHYNNSKQGVNVSSEMVVSWYLCSFFHFNFL